MSEDQKTKKTEAVKPEAKKADAKATAKPDVKADAKKADAKKADVKTTAKPDVKATAKKADVKTTAKPDVKADAKTDEVKTETKTEAKPEAKPDTGIKLDGLFAFKISMTAFYNQKGKRVPVTALQYKPWKVSQIKTKEKEGYSAVQIACDPQKNKRCGKAIITHLIPAGFKEGARYIKEIRQNIPEGIKVGQEVSIHSLKIGDKLHVSSRSKGLGFTGVMKRWNFAGGVASHGSKAHRRTGSIGQHTEPSRVFPGRKMPGRCGFQNQTKRGVEVIDIFPEEGMIFVKGPVPGARHTLVTLQKRERGSV